LEPTLNDPSQPDDAAPDPVQLTQFLNELGQGDARAEAELMPALYRELRNLAQSHLRGSRPDQTLQPTALVHSAYMKLFGSTDSVWDNRKHFFVVAAKAMRQVIIDHARKRGRTKRGGGRLAMTLNEDLAEAEEESIDFLDLDEALAELDAEAPRQARVVELRYFAGLEVAEVAEVLDISKATVERDWRFARAWLSRRMGTSGED